MAVAIDVLGTEGFVTTSTQAATYTGLTTSSVVSNGAVVVVVAYDTHVSASSATWDGVAMTLLASRNTTGASGRVEIYGLAPITGHTGNKTFSLSFTAAGSVGVAMCGTSWSGVNQTGGTTSFPNATNNGGSVTSNGTVPLAVTSATGDIALAAWSTDQQGFLSAVSNTQIFIDSSNFPSLNSGAANYASGAATVNMTGTLSAVTGTCTWAAVGIDIAASAVTSNPIFNPPDFSNRWGWNDLPAPQQPYNQGLYFTAEPRAPHISKLFYKPLAPVPQQAYNPNLYTVVVVNQPFNQYDWPLPKRLKAAPLPPDPLNPNLFTNPYPFNQYDWSKPIKVPQAPIDRSFQFNQNLTNFFPFNQVDWSKPFRTPQAPVNPDQSLNINLFTNPFPFDQYDWSKPFKVRQAPVNPDQWLNINLFTNPYPFNQYDWSKPLRIKQAPFVPTDPVNINLFTNPFPFNQIDWSKPFRTPQAPYSPTDPLNINLFTNPIPILNLDQATPIRRRPIVDSTQPYNVNLYGVVVVSVPFNQVDFARPFVPRPAPFLDPPLNPNIFTNPYPFNQYYLSGAFRVPSSPVDFYNMVLTSAPQALPFNQSDWSKPFKIPQAPINPDQSINVALYSAPFVPPPFIPIDWSTPFKVRQSPINPDQALNINLFTNPYPFNQYDFSKPVKVPRAPTFDYPLNINIFINPFPFNQIDWSKPFKAPRVPLNPDQSLNTNLFTNPYPIQNVTGLVAGFGVSHFPISQQAYNQNLYQVTVSVFVPEPVVTKLAPFPYVPPPPQPYNPNLYSVAAPGRPFFQVDWSKPFNVPRAPVNPDQSLNLNLFTNPIPFSQFEYPRSQRLRINQPIQPPYNNNLYAAPTVTVTLHPVKFIGNVGNMLIR